MGDHAVIMRGLHAVLDVFICCYLVGECRHLVPEFFYFWNVVWRNFDVHALRITGDEVFDEIELMVKHLDFKEETIFRANHASNYNPLRATLPDEKGGLIEQIRDLKARGDYKPEWMRAL